MSSAAQLLANQANARCSTGPTSIDGKARSARNALRHGFRSQTVLLPGDDESEYQALLDELTAYFHPEDLDEIRCVREMADAEWRLRRARLFQERALTHHIETLQAAHPTGSLLDLQAQAWNELLGSNRHFAQLAQFETRFRNQYDSAHRHWLDLQRRRLAAADRQARIHVNTRAAQALAAVDPPVLTNEPNPPAGAARNAPCPCGSGLKYKRCCGRNAPPLRA